MPEDRGAVFTVISTSAIMDQFRRRAGQDERRLPQDKSERPLTCHRPVIPRPDQQPPGFDRRKVGPPASGDAARQRSCHAWRTLMNWGNSSRLYFAQHPSERVTRDHAGF